VSPGFESRRRNDAVFEADISCLRVLKADEEMMPCSRLTQPSKKPARSQFAVLASCVMLVSCLAYSLTLKMEAVLSSETAMDFYRTTRRYIPEDSKVKGYVNV
jgi:hypothetical protein